MSFLFFFLSVFVSGPPTQPLFYGKLPPCIFCAPLGLSPTTVGEMPTAVH